MRLDIAVAPLGGWSSYTRCEELVTWLWANLNLDTWHYLNFTSDTSLWEHREDGSSVYVGFADNRGERVVEMTFSLLFAKAVEESCAFSAFQECLRRFELKMVPEG